MKNMKKLVSLLLAVCLMASLTIGASAAEPTTVDVSGGTRYLQRQPVFHLGRHTRR